MTTIQTLGIEILSGRDFDLRQITDSSAVILNESAADLFGYDDPIGKKIYTLNVAPAVARSLKISKN